MNTTMNTTTGMELALQVSNALRNFGPSRAEETLALIARDGDEMLEKLVPEIADHEVSAILAESDYTSPSLLIHFMKPIQFLAALERLGSNWGRVSGASNSQIERMKEEVSDFVLQVLATEDEQKNKLIRAFLRYHLSHDIVILMATTSGNPLSFFNLEKTERETQFEKGTWQELLVEIQHLDPHSVDDIEHDLRVYLEQKANGEMSHGEDFNPIRTLGDLSRLANKHAQNRREESVPTTAEKDDPFVTL